MLESLLSNTLYTHSSVIKAICDAEFILIVKTGRQCKLAHGLMTYADLGDFVFM